MNRDLSKISSTNYDVLVVGAGIFGAGIAWDCSLRGFKTLLIDKGDFGAATSAGCFKIVHGGLRYLQHFDLRRLWESAEEQRVLRYIAPHLVKPLPFLVPCYQKFMQRKAVLALGVSVYELLTFNRNRKIEPSLKLPRHQVLSREEVLRVAPGIKTEGLTGGVVYYDCQMLNPDRLNLSVVQSAEEAGSDVFNYLSLTDSQRMNSAGVSTLSNFELTDQISGTTLNCSAKIVVDATGPWSKRSWSQRLFGKLSAESAGLSEDSEPVLSKGLQIVVPKLIDNFAIAVESSYSDPAAQVARGSRSYFIQPWREHSLIGTTDELWKGNPDEFCFEREEIKKFLEEIKTAYGSDLLTQGNVSFAFGGLRPLDPDYKIPQNFADGSGVAKTARKDVIVDHLADTAQGEKIANLVTVQGIKYTTFRAVSENAVDLVSKKLGVNTCSKTASTKLVSAPSDLDRFKQQLPEKRADYLLSNYGRSAKEIAEEELRCPGFVSGAKQTSIAEILFAIRNEKVATLADVVLRRTPLGSLGHPGEEAIENVAELMATELGWTEQRVLSEITQLNHFFSTRSLSPTSFGSIETNKKPVLLGS